MPRLPPQGWPAPMALSSMTPLQSLSRPSHTSGPTTPVVLPHDHSHPSEGSRLRSRKPGRHAPRPHTPAAQVAVALGALHTRPQPPQLLGSVMRLMPLSTTPSQSLSRPSHTSGPEGVHDSSQPSAGLRLRSTKPGRHAPMRQAPITHAASAPGKVQAVPQVPQLVTSV